MNTSQIIYNYNKATLKDLIPIKNFKTMDDIDKHLNSNKSIITYSNKKSDCLFVPENDFFHKYNFSNLNKDNFYYNTKSFLNTNSVLYLDKEHFILIDITHHLIFNKDNIEVLNNSLYNCISKSEEYYNEKNYEALLYQVPDCFKLEMLVHLINSLEHIDDDIYSMFMDYYQMMDFGFNSLTTDTLTKLLDSKSNDLKLETINKLSHLPDKIIIYRGQGDKSTNYENAYSWSIVPNIAVFFSLRFNENTGKIVTGVVNKEDILEFFDNDEQEILILPTKVTDIKVYDFYPLKFVNNLIDDETFNAFTNFKYILNSHLNFKDDEYEDRKLHSLRVLLLSLVLGKLKNLDIDDLYLLGLSAIYHDIGKTNNNSDEFYGLQSREIYERDNNIDDDTVKFLIEYHCVDDEIALEELYKSNICDREKAKELLFILKDANTLDRLRFGLRSLDFTYLKNEEAISLLLFSKSAIENIKL